MKKKIWKKNKENDDYDILNYLYIIVKFNLYFFLKNE